MQHLPLMARFNAWANERLYDVVARLPDEAYRADKGAFFGSVHNTLNHLLLVDRLWIGRIEGRDRGIRALDQILHDDFASLRDARREEDRHLVEMMDRLGEEELQRPVRYRRMIGDGQEEARAGHILLTMLNHQTHHRGQIHALLTQMDLVPPPLDVIFFLDQIGEAGPPGTLGTRSA